MLATIVRILTYECSYIDIMILSGVALPGRPVHKFIGRYANIFHCRLHRRASLMLALDLTTNALSFKVVCLLSSSCDRTRTGAR